MPLIQEKNLTKDLDRLHSVTGVSQFASNSPYLIFENEGSAISIQSMEDAIFDALDLKQQGI